MPPLKFVIFVEMSSNVEPFHIHLPNNFHLPRSLWTCFGHVVFIWGLIWGSGVARISFAPATFARHVFYDGLRMPFFAQHVLSGFEAPFAQRVFWAKFFRATSRNDKLQESRLCGPPSHARDNRNSSREIGPEIRPGLFAFTFAFAFA